MLCETALQQEKRARKINQRSVFAEAQSYVVVYKCPVAGRHHFGAFILSLRFAVISRHLLAN